MRAAVGPVHILQDEHQRAEMVEQRDGGAEHPVPLGPLIGQRRQRRRQVLGDLGQQRRQRPDDGVGRSRPGQLGLRPAERVEQRRQRQRFLELFALTHEPAGYGQVGRREQFGDQAALADSRLALDQGERGPCADDRAQEGQLDVPADEDVRQGARRHAATPYLHRLV